MKKELSTLLFSLLLFVCQATPAPDFTITTTDGVQRQLYNDYVNQGKVLVFEVFFTSCPPCSSHAPSWQALYQNMLAAHPGQVEFLILSTLTSDMNSVVATYRTNKGLTMPGALEAEPMQPLQTIPELYNRSGNFIIHGRRSGLASGRYG